MADFPETTPDERQALQELKTHPGWLAFKKRLRHMQVQMLRKILDPSLKAEREANEGQLEVLRTVEVIPDWMLLEKGRPLTREEAKQLKFPPLIGELTEEHLEALD